MFHKYTIQHIVASLRNQYLNSTVEGNIDIGVISNVYCIMNISFKHFTLTFIVL